MTYGPIHDPLHREQREALGAFALDQLSGEERTGLQAHLDGCAACRAELAEIASVVPDLRSVDPWGLGWAGEPISPPAQLGGAIAAAVARERALRLRKRAGRTALTSVAAGVVVAVVLGAGVLVGQRTTGSGAPPVIPMEQVTLRPLLPGVSVSSAVLIAHTWGVELRFVAVGLRNQETYRAAFRTTDGSMRPAGEFLGVGGKRLTCNMQSALLRSAATGFVVLDAAGRPVLEAPLKV